MKKSTKRTISFFLLAGAFLAFIWTVPHYLGFVSSHPIDYYLFRSSVSDGHIIVVKRDTTPIGWGMEDVFLKDTTTGMMYKLEHRFAEHEKFSEPIQENYENIYDENGKEICHRDDDEAILNLLNNNKK